MHIRLFQIDPGRDREGFRFRSYDETVHIAEGVDPSRYVQSYDGDLEADDLEDVFDLLNRTPPVGYTGRSMSVSDVVLTEGNGKNVAPGAYFCDVFGFREVDNFDSSLAAVPSGGYRMLVLEPHRPPYAAVIDGSLESLQAAVGGWIECTYPFDDNAFVIGNEEAKLIGMEGNRRIGGAVYAGPLLIAADDGEGGTKDLTDEQIRMYSERFRVPDEITQAEVEADTGYRIYTFD